jgi:hypothetical protein
MQLFRPNGQLLQQVAGMIDGERFDLEFTETGTYTIRIYGAGRGVFTTYDLEVAIARNCRDDDFEPNDQADQAVDVEPGVYENRLICGDDDDWHRLALYAGEVLVASIDFVSSLGDLELVLYDDERQIIERADTEGDREELTYTARTPQVVLLQVPGGAELINGYTFTVDVEPPGCESDPRENDDEPAAATPLFTGDQVQGTLCANDPDWFSLVLPADVPLSLTLDHDYTYGDLTLEVFADDAETLVASAETDADVEVIEFLIDNPGQYYVRVSGIGRSQGSYTLSAEVGYTVDCPTDDRYEPNDHLAQSALLHPPGRHGDVIMCDDDDWYRFQLQEGQSVEVYVLTIPGEGRLELDLLGPDATRDNDRPVHSAVGPAPTKRVRAPLGSPAGTWKVRVRRFSGEAVRYSIRLFIFDGPLPLSCEFDDDLEPDDEALDATRVREREVYDAIVCENDSDWFRIDAEAGEILNVRIDFEHLSGDVDATLYRGQPPRPVVRSSSMNDNEFLRFQATSDGPVFVEVTYAGEQGGNTYSLILSRLQGPQPQSCELDDQFEQNDDFANATLLEPGIHTAIRCGDDADFFGVDLEEGQFLRATLAWGGDVPLGLDLFGPGNIGVASAEDVEISARQISHQTQSSGRYALAVTGDEAGDALYTLRFEVLDVEPVQCGPSDDQEDNDSLVDATLVVEDTEHAELSLCGADEDWFRVNVPPQASLLVEALFDPLAGDLQLEAFGDGGDPYAASYGPGGAERLVLEANRDEAVFLVRAFLRDSERRPLSYSLGFYYAGVSGCAEDENEPNESRSTGTTVVPGTYDAVTLCPNDIEDRKSVV